MSNRVALKKKMRVGDRMEFSNGVVYELSSQPPPLKKLDGNIDTELLEKFSKNWFSVLFKIPIEIKFTFIKGDRNVEPT
ncbi:hypothetical protein MASR1M48_16430 [Lactococcus petauri]